MIRPRRMLSTIGLAASLAAAAFARPTTPAAQELVIGIGTQNTTTNTVTTGIVIRELRLLDRHLPRTGRYAGTTYRLDWQNFTSGPPITNAMMANKLQFGAMGDYPLVVNGHTFASNPESRSQLIAVAAYNLLGAGNGIIVNVRSPYYSLADLRGKVVSTPFGSAAHGMVLRALQDAGLPPDFVRLVNQSPEVGSTNLQEMKIDGHSGFVPFAQLLPFRGFARAVFDGVQTRSPTWHGVVVRTDFAERHPEVVSAYIRAILDANAWVREDPERAARQIATWTGIDKEVVYIFLGPGGLMTLDPTIKPPLIEGTQQAARVLQNLGRLGPFDVNAWANDRYLRAAYEQAGLDYEAARAGTTNYQVEGQDAFCNRPVEDPRQAGQVWIEGEAVRPAATAACALAHAARLRTEGRRVAAVYVQDHGNGLKLFADQAFYAVGPGAAGATRAVAPFLLRADAEAHARTLGGSVEDMAGATRAAAGPL